MTKKILITILFCSLLTLQAATDISSACKLTTRGLEYDAKAVSSGKIQLNLGEVLQNEDILLIRNEMAACRSQVLANISASEDRIFVLLNDKAAIQSLRNIEDLLKQQKTLAQQQHMAKKSLAAAFDKIQCSGLYAVVVDGSVGYSRTRLLEAAKNLFASKALEDLRRLAIDSATMADNVRPVFDRIADSTSGQIEIEHTALEERKFFKARNQLVYAVVARVYPFKGKAQRGSARTDTTTGYMADLLVADGLETFKTRLPDLTSNSYAEEVGARLSRTVETWQKTVKLTNDRAVGKENSLLEALSDSLSRKEKGIAEVKAAVDEARKELRLIYEEIGFGCNGLPETCIDTAIQEIEAQIQTEISNGLNEKEKELVWAEERIDESGNQAGEIRQTIAQAMYQKLKTSHGRREQLMSFTEANFDTSTEAGQRQSYYITREPHKVTLYPFIDEDDQLRLLMVMNFKVSGENAEAGKNEHKAKEIARQGDRFIAYDNGTVLDTKTGLMWAARDNGRDVTWWKAKVYCDNYRGGGHKDWRMPTRDELAGLYETGTGYSPDCCPDCDRLMITSLIRLSCCCPWAAETRGSDAAYFGFSDGDQGWDAQSYSTKARALPVRRHRKVTP